MPSHIHTGLLSLMMSFSFAIASAQTAPPPLPPAYEATFAQVTRRANTTLHKATSTLKMNAAQARGRIDSPGGGLSFMPPGSITTTSAYFNASSCLVDTFEVCRFLPGANYSTSAVNIF